MKIVVIAPPGGPRNGALLGQLGSLDGHDVLVFDAVFPDRYPEGFDPSRGRAMNNRDLTIGEVGCALSHRSVWEMHAEDDDEWLCVMEDDASIRDLEAFDQMLSHASRSRPAPTGTVVNLYSTFALLPDDEPMPRAVVEPPCGVTYIVSVEAARRLAVANRDLGFTADWPRGSGVEFRLGDLGVVEHDDSVASLIGSSRLAARLDRPIGRHNLHPKVMLNRIGLYSGVHYLRYRRYFGGLRQYYRLVLHHRVVHHMARLIGRPVDRSRPGIRVVRSLPRRGR